jgi:hypothetical protein
VAEVISGPRRPTLPKEGLVGVAAVALYEARDVYGSGTRDVLLTWSRQRHLADTALAAVYFGLLPSPPPDHTPLLSPFPLNQTQHDVVRRARTERVVVASGPPGNGKSHAVVAAAREVVNRGGSVLIATQSTHAADLLGELLVRYPGPAPVLFGDTEQAPVARRRTRLGAGGRGGPGRPARGRRGGHPRGGEGARADRRDRRLARRGAGGRGHEPLGAADPRLAADVPGAFAPDADLARAARTVDSRWFRRWRLRGLRRRLGATDRVPLERLRSARTLRAGRNRRREMLALRFVSFVADVDIATTLRRYGLADWTRAGSARSTWPPRRRR